MPLNKVSQPKHKIYMAQKKKKKKKIKKKKKKKERKKTPL